MEQQSTGGQSPIAIMFIHRAKKQSKGSEKPRPAIEVMLRSQHRVNEGVKSVGYRIGIQH